MNNRIDIGIEHNYRYLNGKGKIKNPATIKQFK